MVFGTADPPTIISRSWSRFQRSGSASSASRIAIHTVGTPAVTVTSSSASSSSTLSASRRGPGSTSPVPAKAAMYGSPQAFTWNMGTTGRIVS